MTPFTGKKIEAALRDLPLGGLRYYASTTSTNNLALSWAAEGAPDLALVVADEQTAGRGRFDRRWYTPAGSALAISLVIRPNLQEAQFIARFTALGALSVCEALRSMGLRSEVKWPNDVLVDRRKVCGILAETVWFGEHVEAVVVGIGVNVSAASIPDPARLNFTAASLETESGTHPGRLPLLHSILEQALAWRLRLCERVFIREWEARLAFLEEMVVVQDDQGNAHTGRLKGLGMDGSLRLALTSGGVATFQGGEVQLRPQL